MNPTILVLGGGRSALEAAREVVAQGGRAVLAMPPALPKTCGLRAPSGIEVVAGSELVALEGSLGRFTASLMVDGDTVPVRCDAVLLAEDAPDHGPGTGGVMRLEEALTGKLPEQLGRVAVVLGPAASRADHVRSLELALRMRSRPDRPEVTLFAKELLAHGRAELAYADAQREGARVVRTRGLPEISTGLPLRVTAVDHPSGLEIKVCPDLLIAEGLATPSENAPSPSCSCSGNISMGPVSSMREGVLLCGTRDRDLLDEEVVTEARAAATRAMTIAFAPVIRATNAAQVDRDRCSACLTCVRSCPFRAPRIDEEGKAAIDVELCQACGICVATCPSRALTLASDQEWKETASSMFTERTT
jgi:heterodisulfide reductase subunit A